MLKTLSSMRSCASALPRSLTTLLLVGLSACATPAPQPPPKPAPVADCPTPAESVRALREELPPSALLHDAMNIPAQGGALHGTLSHPSARERKLPGVLILHDAGPLDRDGHISGSLGVQWPAEIPIYATLSEHLARQGFVVLRYDKRSCLKTHRPRCAYDSSMLQPFHRQLPSVLEDDAARAIKALAARPEVDPERLAIIGHGQGAELALSLSARHPNVRALVLLAPSPYPVDQLIAHQLTFSADRVRQQAEAEGNSPTGDALRQQLTILEQDQKEHAQRFEALRRGNTTARLISGVHRETWAQLFALHTRAMARLREEALPPTLALFGEADTTGPTDTPQRWRQLLPDPSTRHSLQVLPRVTHNMLVAPPTPASLEDDDDPFAIPTPSVTMLAASALFLKGALSAPPRSPRSPAPAAAPGAKGHGSPAR